MPSSLADPALLNHFSVAIYPFLHAVNGPNRIEALEVLQASWDPWWARLSDAEMTDALEDSAFFLPYVRGLLFPEAAILSTEAADGHSDHPVPRLRRVVEQGLSRFAQHLPPSAILRLTLAEKSFRPLAAFHLVGPERAPGKGPRREVPCRLDWVDALLFPSGIGFLLVKVRLDAEAAGLAQLIDLNLAIRTVHPPASHWSLPKLRFPAGGEEVTVRDLLNFLTQGLVGGPTVLDESPLAVPGGPLSEPPYTDTDPGRAYGEHCQLFSYACIHLTETERANLPAGPFASGADRLLYEYAACIRLEHSVHHPVWVPAPEQVERVCRDNRLAMWRCWQAMALKESCVFLGTEDLGFNRRTLPYNIEHDYLPLYLYTLYQKIQLLIFSNDLMSEVAQVESHLRGARALLRRFVAFRNRFWFSEVTHKPQGGDLYRLMQQSLDVPTLYQMVTASVKEAKEYYQDRWDRQVRLGMMLLGWSGSLLTLWGTLRTIYDFLKLHPVPFARAGSLLPWAVIASVAASAALGIVVLLSGRKSLNRRPGLGRSKVGPGRGDESATIDAIRFPDDARPPTTRAA